MWWLWARFVAASALATPAPGHGTRGADAAIAPSVAPRAVTADLAGPERREHTPSHTSADPPVPPPAEIVTLVDADVVHALDERQPSFLRCFRIAQKDDLMLVRAQVALRVTVGPTGTVDDAHADGGTRTLDACVEAVARRLSFGPPERPVEATLTLFFQ